MQKPWLLYAILTIVTWGFYGLFVKLAVRHLNALSAYLLALLPTLAFFLFSFAVPRFRPQWESPAALFAILAGVVGTAGTVFFYKAMVSGAAAVITPLTALYPVVTVILALLFLGEKLNVSQTVGIFLALIAALLLSR